MHRVAIEDPAKLCVRRHVRLHEQSVLLLVKTAGHVERKRFIGAAAKLRRHLAHGDRVHVHNAIEGFIFIRKAREILDRAKIVSDRQIARGLHAGKHGFFIACHVWKGPFLPVLSNIIQRTVGFVKLKIPIPC